MKTPAEAFKENFWIGAKGGLLDRKHNLRMGDAVWLFLYLLREQTALNTAGEGIANYGHPKTFQQIGEEMKGIPTETIRRWASTLRREQYIRTEYHGHDGLTFWILKGKAKTRKVKITHEEAKSMQESAQKLQRARRANLNGEEVSPRVNLNAESFPPRAELNGERVPINPQAVVSEFVADIFKTPTPKGFTPKSLSYYNKHAATPCVSVSESQEPTPKATPSLQEQSERLKALHPEWFGRTGQAAIERKEATA